MTKTRKPGAAAQRRIDDRMKQARILKDILEAEAREAVGGRFLTREEGDAVNAEFDRRLAEAGPRGDLLTREQRIASGGWWR